MDVLKAGYAEGRLTAAEYEQRMGRAYQSYTYGELSLLISDLPQGPVPGMMPGPMPGPMSGPIGQPIPPTFLPPPSRPTNPYAIGALICGLGVCLGGITAIPAVILGYTAKAQLRQSGEEGDGLANVGLVLGWLGGVWWLFFWFFSLVHMVL